MFESPVKRLAFQVKHVGFRLRFLSYVLSQRPWKQIDVILTPRAQQYLDIGDADTFQVEFSLADRQGGHNQQPGEDITDQPVAILRDGQQVGVLDTDTSSACRPALEAGQTMFTYATRKRGEHGQWRLLISRPLF